jgi:hypothetical protein
LLSAAPSEIRFTVTDMNFTGQAPVQYAPVK